MGKNSPPVQRTIRRVLGHLRREYAPRSQVTFANRIEMVLSLQGVVAQVSLSGLQFGSYFSISVVTGIAATLGVLIAGPVSGGHLNPSVTFAFVVFRRLSPRKALLYFLGQVRGCRMSRKEPIFDNH
jgi:aquaporin-3